MANRPTGVGGGEYADGQTSVLEHKNIDVDFKAASDDGTFVALASVFNNVDRVGDRVLPGAFKKTLRKWKASGKMLPVILSHNWNDIQAHIGYADPKEIRETPRGLEVKAHLDTSESETARRVHKLMKRGQLTAMSFGYTVPDGGQEIDEKGVNNLSEIDLHEVGPTLVGVNSEAQLQAVKKLEAETKGDEGSSEGSVRKRPEEKLRKQLEQSEREQIAKQLPPSLPDEEGEEYAELLASIRVLDEEERRKVKALIDEKAWEVEGVEVEEKPEPKPAPELRKQAEHEEREQIAEHLPPALPPAEQKAYSALWASIRALDGTQRAEIQLLIEEKAVWSAAFINELPDSAFLYVESGGEKDESGKTTPRSLRHLPYKGPNGEVDLPHLRNALARIPQSNLPQDVKDRLTRKAEAILSSTKAVEIENGKREEPPEAKSRPNDPLRKRSLETVLEVTSAGLNHRKPSQVKAPPPKLDEAELRRRSRDLDLDLLN